MSRIASLFRTSTLSIFVIATILGSFSAAILSSSSTYAAPEDYKDQAACEAEGYEWDGDNDACVEAVTSSCGVEGIGWIICPAMDFMGSAADMAFNFLADNFLSTNPTYIGGETVAADGTKSRPVYDAWSVMRTFANIAFVIAFMIIVYSQLTSAGISNYGVKKLLPRLIIAAILVNLSFIVCQIAVDISNILGYSLKTLFEGIGGLITPDGSLDPTKPSASTEGGMAIFIAGLLVAGITLAFTVSVPVLLAIVLALLMIALILVMRIALIITLTIISPLAFVAFLLPNTEQWFKKWYKMFFALLMVFPIISVVFGAGSLVGMVINNAAIAENPDDPNQIMQLIAFGVTAIPLFLVPSLLKSSINAAGAIGTKLSNMASKQQSAAASKGKAKFGERYQRSRLADAQRGFNNRLALGRAKRRSKGLGAALDQSRLGRTLGLDKGAAAAMSMVDQQDEKDVSQELTRFKNTNGATDLGGAAAAMEKAIKDGDSTKARAMQRYLAGAGGVGVKALEKVYSSSSDTIRKKGNGAMQQSLASDALGLGMKGKSAAIDSFSTEPADKNGNRRGFDDIQANKDTYTRLSTSELAGQKNLEQLMTPKGQQLVDDKGRPRTVDGKPDGAPLLGLGVVDQAMAQAVMDSEPARDAMSVKDRSRMATLAGNTSSNPAPAATGGNTTSSSSSAPSSGGGGSSGGSGTP